MKSRTAIRLAIFLFVLGSACNRQQPARQQVLFFAGSSDTDIECPIFLCRLDYATNRIAVIDSFSGSRGSSYLALSSDHRFLYAIDKRLWDTVSGEQMVSSFRVDPESFRLEYLNSQSSGGVGPNHISCSSDGGYIFTSNYWSGSVAVLPIAEDGKILPASDLETYSGSGPHPERQTSPHAHQVMLDPTGKFLLSPDLGTDRVMIFRFDKSTGTLEPNPRRPYFRLAPGAGPRHLDFHPGGRYFYVVNELNGTLTACRFEKDTGEITELNTLSTLPGDYSGENASAAVRVHPNGNFVYASNRGEISSIAVFRILDDGSIERIQVLEQVPYPRDFNIDPSGKILLVAGEQADRIELYFIDDRTGRLSPSGEGINIPAPGNILFIKNRT